MPRPLDCASSGAWTPLGLQGSGVGRRTVVSARARGACAFGNRNAQNAGPTQPDGWCPAGSAGTSPTAREVRLTCSPDAMASVPFCPRCGTLLDLMDSDSATCSGCKFSCRYEGERLAVAVPRSAPFAECGRGASPAWHRKRSGADTPSWSRPAGGGARPQRKLRARGSVALRHSNTVAHSPHRPRASRRPAQLLAAALSLVRLQT